LVGVERGVFGCGEFAGGGEEVSEVVTGGLAGAAGFVGVVGDGSVTPGAVVVGPGAGGAGAVVTAGGCVVDGGGDVVTGGAVVVGGSVVVGTVAQWSSLLPPCWPWSTQSCPCPGCGSGLQGLLELPWEQGSLPGGDGGAAESAIAE